VLDADRCAMCSRYRSVFGVVAKRRIIKKQCRFSRAGAGRATVRGFLDGTMEGTHSKKEGEAAISLLAQSVSSCLASQTCSSYSYLLWIAGSACGGE